MRRTTRIASDNLLADRTIEFSDHDAVAAALGETVA